MYASRRATILLVRTGRDERNAAEGRWDPMTGGLAGLSGETAPWLRERDVAVLGGDGVSDALPTLVPEWAMPIHTLALVALGVHLIDNMQLSPPRRCMRVAGAVGVPADGGAAAAGAGHRFAGEPDRPVLKTLF